MIVIAGDALVDLIVRADGSITAVPGGGTYNAARAVGRLGVPASWIGGLSSDRFGRELEAGLTGSGVGLAMVQRTELPTTLALAEIGADGAARYHFYTDSTSAPAVLPGPLAGGLPADTDAVLTGTLGFVLEPMATTLEAMVASLPPELLLMIDPNCRPSITRDPETFRARMARVLARADIVKVSTEDLEFLRPGEHRNAAAAWVQALGPRVVLVTDGAAPVRVLIDGVEHQVPAPRVDVVDTIGAGDTFGGAFLACLVQGGGGRHAAGDTEAVLRAARFAVRASAFVCRQAGANPPTLAELGGWPA
ncbi:MAG: carbohydrate kinase [Chloroflexota bacterium]